MKGWWSDTLFKRLFLLMWAGLVASHLIAFSITTGVHAPPRGMDRGIDSLPTMPSLPPMGSPPADARYAGPPPGMAHDGMPPPEGPAPRPEPREPPDATGPRGGMPASALWLDYGIRFLAIGVFAWFGARWLSAPMRRLAEAAEGLGCTLGQARRAPQLDAQRGTLEVRQTAQVFNTMAQRLHAQFEAQGLLMAAISHDLRTPLARLRMRLEMMEAQPQSERCIADVREMDALIGSVLELMRAPHAPAERERVDLNALLQSLVDDLAEQGQPAELSAPAPAAAPIVLAQPAALNRLLGNLIGNALRQGGSAQVAVAVLAGEAQVTIDDRGPGIPEHQLDAVFQPFYRVDASRSRDGSVGTGLGLYIARDLAERNGGRLKLANRVEGGLRATLGCCRWPRRLGWSARPHGNAAVCRPRHNPAARAKRAGRNMRPSRGHWRRTPNRLPGDPTTMHHDHDHGLVHDLHTLNATRLKRRRALAWMASVGAGALPLIGCGGSSAETGSSTTTTTTSSGTTVAVTPTGSCSMVPTETNGPYPADGSTSLNALLLSGIVRSDIRSSFAGATGVAAGVPLTVTLTLVNTNASCASLAGYAIYIWHCDRAGLYSLYSPGVTGENYLRGMQATDSNGQVTFTTVFPACYAGRWPHIHFEVFPSLALATSVSRVSKISQIALPQAACDAVYASTGYSASVSNLSRITLASDNVFADGVTLEMATVTGSVTAGYAAALTVGIAA